MLICVLIPLDENITFKLLLFFIYLSTALSQSVEVYVLGIVRVLGQVRLQPARVAEA